MSKAKLKVVTTTQLKAKLPATTAARRSGKSRGKSLMITVPDETRAALRARAGAEETTVRVLVLQALKTAGYPVPDDELVDRRRVELGR